MGRRKRGFTGDYEELVYESVRDGRLEIDDQGRIWRVKVPAWGFRNGLPRKLIPCERRRAEILNARGYLFVNRSHPEYGTINTQAARLIWYHVHGPIPEGLTINHRNGDKQDSRPANLELATMQEQITHSMDVLGNSNGRKVTESNVIEIRRRHGAGESLRVLARTFGMAKTTIARIVRRETYRHLV